MKKLFTIGLLILFCLNLVGYKFIANFYANRSSAELQVILDEKKFNASDLVSFKLPLNQPYIVNTDGYESLEGNMDYKGVNYQFVKKRIINDTLEIVCIPNTDRTRIDKNSVDIAKQLNDIVNANGSKKSSNSQNLNFSFSDYTMEHYFDVYHFVNGKTLSHLAIDPIYNSFDYLQDLVQPPEA